MRAHLTQLWIQTRESYWFIPSMMATAAILLSMITTAIDAQLDTDWLEDIPFFYANQPDGAQSLLATVAGSMITVTGITFSLTLLAVSHATGHFGPRLITNFMRDRGNQITLGTFVATFLYCLMVLRTVRHADTATQDASLVDPLDAFVPHVSIAVALLLTIASVGVLIYYIHHIPESIRLSNVVADIGRELRSMIPDIFPEPHDADSDEDMEPDVRLELPEHFEELSAVISSPHDGYVQAIDETGLINIASKHQLTLKLCARPGRFVSRSQPLLFASPSERITDGIEKDLRFTFAMGDHRTSNQNALFLVDQLVEVATRALSPGTNDPMSANTCIDWLQSALIQLTQRKPPHDSRLDDAGTLRLVTHPVTFEEFCSAIFDQLRPYVTSDRNTSIHLMEMIASVATAATKNEHKQLLKRYADELLESAETNGLCDIDFRDVRESYEKHELAFLIR